MWYESYQDALKAIGNRKWAQAEEKLKAALRSGPAPGRGIRTHGVRVMDYLPEYYLGVVYFNQQRYADALEQFAKVQASGLVGPTTAEYHPLADMSEICRIRTGGTAAAAEGHKEADGLVRLARDLIARGSFDEARKTLGSAREKDAGATGLADAFAELAKAEAEARAKQDDARRAEAARAAAEAAEHQKAVVTPSASPSPSPGGRTPSTADVQGTFEAFYGGRYEDAGRLFEQLAAQDARERPRFLFYAACSQAALGLLRGDSGRDRLDRARRLYGEGGAAAARLASRDSFVSPRIIEALQAH
jgi:tetratricopeptide (TPR) repeat protein